MAKFVSFVKRSKKAQREFNTAKRGDWGNVKPYGNIIPNKKAYNRKRRMVIDM